MLRAVVASLALLIALPVSAEEMQAPRVVSAQVDWQAAATAAGTPDTPPAQTFARLNGTASASFSTIAQSPVPVLLPYDAGALQGSFQATQFFLPGPHGYDTAFALKTSDVRELSDVRYREPVYVLLSGLRVVYELDGPPLPEGTPVKDLEEDFPGIRRVLHESYVRYVFVRFGATYVASIYCQDRRPRPKILTCRQADRVAVRFLRALKLAGGSPEADTAMATVALARPERASSDFTYYSPGFLIPGTGLKKDIAGRADYTVYARLRFPIKDTPAFANSQSFNSWGDCDFTGRIPRRLGRKGMAYTCKVNGLPLTFDESAGSNYSYPWRDNYCEHRYFLVGQCPGGLGHQGQDIRASYCKQFNDGADRCLPYQHDVVGARDGTILRTRKQEALYLFVNAPDAHVRLRYIHMNPVRLDADGMISGRQIREGEVLGQVGTYNKFERGTTYHLHLDMQVPTRVGWVFVNPYISLVAAYEHLIGARGTEIKDGDPAPPLAGVPPVVERRALGPATPVSTAAAPLAPLGPSPAQENVSESVKPHKAAPRKRRYARKKKHETAEAD